VVGKGKVDTHKLSLDILYAPNCLLIYFSARLAIFKCFFPQFPLIKVFFVVKKFCHHGRRSFWLCGRKQKTDLDFKKTLNVSQLKNGILRCSQRKTSWNLSLMVRVMDSLL
jgi:hypothetical protein